MAFDLKKELTEKMQGIITLIKNEKPSEATHIKMCDGFHQSRGAFGTVNCWTSIDCRYLDEEGNTIQTIEAHKVGDQQMRDAINYVLYTEGLYKPYSEENLKVIQKNYYGLLDFDMIEAFNGLYSPQYQMKLICKEIIENRMEDVNIAFILDYDYAENRTDMKWNKKEYSFRGQITYGDKQYTTPCMWDTNVHMLIGKVYNELKDVVPRIIISYDMLDVDRDKFEGHLNWCDSITF